MGLEPSSRLGRAEGGNGLAMSVMGVRLKKAITLARQVPSLTYRDILQPVLYVISLSCLWRALLSKCFQVVFSGKN